MRSFTSFLFFKTAWDARNTSDSFFDGIYTLRVTEMTSKRKSHDQSESSEGSNGRRSKVDTALGDAPLFLQTKVSQESQIFKRKLSKMASCINIITTFLSIFANDISSFDIGI